MKTNLKTFVLTALISVLIPIPQSYAISSNTPPGSPYLSSEYKYTEMYDEIDDSIERLQEFLPESWYIPNIEIVDGVCPGNSPSCTNTRDIIYFEEDYFDTINLDPVMLHELTHCNLKVKWKVGYELTYYGQTDDLEYTAEAVTRYVYGAVNFRRLIVTYNYRAKYPYKYPNASKKAEYYSELYEDIYDIFGQEFYYESYNDSAATLGYYIDTRKYWVKNLINRAYQQKAAQIMKWNLK